MKLNTSYNQADFLSFLDDFLPDFSKDIRPVSATDKNKIIQEIKYLGSSEDLNLQVFELKIFGKTEKKVSQAIETFKLLKNYQSYRALVVYSSDDDINWRLALVQMTPDVEKGKKITKFSNPRRYSFYLGPEAKIKTPENFLIRKGKIKDFDDLFSRFSVEVVNKDFYNEIARFFNRLVGGDVKFKSKTEHFKSEMVLPSIDKSDRNIYQEFAVRIIGRIIFCWFLKQKKSDKDISLLPDEFLSVKAVKNNSSYYHQVLEKIFFEVLNKPVEQRDQELTNGLSKIPYLNGGLFDPHDDDFYESKINYALKIPDKWFKDLFEILETYNFTIDENTVMDTDLSIDPEMLGRIFENLLAEINPETGESARKSTGSYYTPRQIVEYMVDQSLIQYLLNKTKIKEDKIKALVSFDEADDEKYPLNQNEKKKIVDALDEVRIIDPACGSGAFPIGILQKIVFVLGKVDTDGKLWFEKKIENYDSLLKDDFRKKFENENFDYIRKTGVIKDSIYGVDIQPIAVEVSKLRCFLTLIVDEDIDDKANNRGIKPLPNLEFKFVAANTLVDLPGSAPNGGQIGMYEDNSEIDQLKKLRDQYFVSNGLEKERIKSDFKDIQREMFKKQITKGGHGHMTMALAGWDPFKDETSSWFDPEWMFGIENFDIVIANPPYISYGLRGTQKLLPEERRLLCSTFPNSAEYKISIYALFMDKAIQLSKKDDGVQTYIVPDSFLLGRYFSKIRKLILKECEINQISWLPYKIFEATVGYSVIYTFTRKNPNLDHIVSARFIKNNNEFQDKTYQHHEYYQSYFNEQKYNRFRLFFDEYSMEFVNKVENKTQILGSIIKISSGLIAFNSQSSIISENKKDDKWLKGIISGKEIKKYTITPQGHFLLYDKSKIKSGYDCAEYFKEKLFMRQTGDKLVCAFDNEGLLALNNVHIGNLKNNNYSLKFIATIINSKLMNFYYKIISLETGRTMAQTDIETLERLPIKEISKSEQKPFIDLVDKIMVNTKSTGYLENPIKQANVHRQEKQIDQMVYKLYGLTKEEIKIVENN